MTRDAVFAGVAGGGIVTKDDGWTHSTAEPTESRGCWT
jgi:hypothetical protein